MKLIKCEDTLIESIDKDNLLSVISESKESSSPHSHKQHCAFSKLRNKNVWLSENNLFVVDNYDIDEKYK